MALPVATRASPQETVNWSEHKLGPKSSVSVLWVGHSLVEQKAATPDGDVTLMSLVGDMARQRGLAYKMGDHTLWGAALAGLWNGRDHTTAKRDDLAPMREKREAFERDAAGYDTLVATERIPLHHSIKGEFSTYYLRKFYCALRGANAASRVYLYEVWPNFQDDTAPWRQTVAKDRAEWDRLGDIASSARVRTPGLLSHLRLSHTTNAGCTLTGPIFTVPVASTFAAVHDRLAAPQPGDVFTRPDGSRFRMIDLVANPDENRDVSGETKGPARGAKLRDPSKPFDDIHSSVDGIYVTALVHFATLYRQSPVGLKAPASLGPGLARTLQCIAWQTVLEDPRAGVSGDLGCNT